MNVDKYEDMTITHRPMVFLCAILRSWYGTKMVVRNKIQFMARWLGSSVTRFAQHSLFDKNVVGIILTMVQPPRKVQRTMWQGPHLWVHVAPVLFRGHLFSARGQSNHVHVHAAHSGELLYTWPRTNNLQIRCMELHWDQTTPTLAILHQEHYPHAFVLAVYDLQGKLLRNFTLPTTRLGKFTTLTLRSHPVAKEFLVLVDRFGVHRFNFNGDHMDMWEAPRTSEQLLSMAVHPTQPHLWIMDGWCDLQLLTVEGRLLNVFSLYGLDNFTRYELRVHPHRQLLLCYSHNSIFFYSFTGRILYEYTVSGERDFVNPDMLSLDESDSRIDIALSGGAKCHRLIFE